MKRKTKNIVYIFLTLCLVGAFIYLEYDIVYHYSGHYLKEYAEITQPVFYMAFCFLWGILIGLIFTPKEVFLRNIVLIPVLLATLVFNLSVIAQASFNFHIELLIPIGVYTLFALVGAYAMSFLKWLICKAVTLTRSYIQKNGAQEQR